MNLDEIYALIDANRAAAEQEYYNDRLKLEVHKPFDVPDRDSEPILLARQAQHAERFKSEIVDNFTVNPEIWKWYDMLFVHRPEKTFSVNTKYSVLKSSAPREHFSQESKSKFAKFDRNIINELLKFCGIQTVARLSAVNSWLYKLCMLKSTKFWSVSNLTTFLTGMKEEVWEELFSRLCTLKDNCEREFQCPIKFKTRLDKQDTFLIGSRSTLQLPISTTSIRYYQDTKSLLKQMEIRPGVQDYDPHTMNYSLF